MKNPLITLGLCAAISATVVADEPVDGKSGLLDDLNYGFWVDWSSRHTSRGRDFLDGKGAFSQGFHLGTGHLGIEMDRSGALQDGTKEFNFDFYYYRKFEGFSISGAYEYSDWKNDNFQVDGNSLSAGITYFGLPEGLWISGDVGYSIDRDGFFSEFSIGSDLELYEWLTLTPAVSVGFNSGYFDEGHNGFNHIEASFSADFLLTDHLRLNASAAYNWALNRKTDLLKYPDDAILKDFFWTGFTLSYDGNHRQSRERKIASRNSWRMAFGTSTWATALSGSLSIGAGSPGTVRAIDDSYDQLHTGLYIEARRGPWSVFIDGSYVSFAAEVPPPLPIFSSTQVEVRMAEARIAAGYRVCESRRGSIDLLAGIRYNFLETQYQFRNPENRDLSWLDPSVGIGIRTELLEKIFLSTRAEVGGFDLGSDYFWQVDVGLSFQLSDHLSVDLRYQHLEIDYTREDNDVQFSFKGPKIEASYRF